MHSIVAKASLLELGNKTMSQQSTTAARIRQARQAKGWSMQQLADRIGAKSRNQIFYYESGKANLTLTTLSRLAEALGVGINQLLNDEK